MNHAIASIVRVLVAAALGGMVAKGWLTNDDVEKIVAYVTGLAGIAAIAVWSVVRNNLTPLLNRLAERSEVKEIIVETDDIADASPSSKVISESQHNAPRGN